MNGLVHRREVVRERVVNAAALLVLMFVGGMALIGPSGVVSWGEQASRLDDHQARIAILQDRRSVLENRVDLLHPDRVDADLASELVRGNLNVAHPDEFVYELETLD